ncbi:hypothetical protein V1517DRAFT_354656 [Lipomyces orientalis]|uniref:Uncharacterized protein n=1 Tax=Lipomyces orientalis TaxID=1233043 RepID=A0ACC3TG88_9ASCO
MSLVPPFTQEIAQKKVKIAQISGIQCTDLARVIEAYQILALRNRTTFEQFSKEKWTKETQDRLRENYFHLRTIISLYFRYEWYDVKEKSWYRTYDLEDWTFAADGCMQKRQMSGNDLQITEDERWFKPSVDVNSVEIGPQRW